MSSPWIVTVSPVPVTLTGITLATTAGVTGIFQGQTNQLIATCLYSDGSTTSCNTTDSHGNVAGSYTSSAPGHATVNAITGLVTGVGAGTTNLTAQAGTFTTPICRSWWRWCPRGPTPSLFPVACASPGR